MFSKEEIQALILILQRTPVSLAEKLFLDHLIFRLDAAAVEPPPPGAPPQR